MTAMIFPQGMPQQDKLEKFMEMGNRLWEDHQPIRKERGYYSLVMAFIISEVWSASYEIGAGIDMSPSERQDRRESFVIFGKSIQGDRFVCQVELKRYRDHIQAGNEIYRELRRHDEKKEQGLDFYPLDALFYGYAIREVASHSENG